MTTVDSPFSETGWLWLTSLINEQEFLVLSRLPTNLHRGEASCLAIARHRSWLFLTDDLAARKEAERQEIIFSGSLGCLVHGIRRNFLSLEQANIWLGKMIQHGYRTPLTDLTGLINRNMP